MIVSTTEQALPTYTASRSGPWYSIGVVKLTHASMWDRYAVSPTRDAVNVQLPWPSNAKSVSLTRPDHCSVPDPLLTTTGTTVAEHCRNTGTIGSLPLRTSRPVSTSLRGHITDR